MKGVFVALGISSLISHAFVVTLLPGIQSAFVPAFASLSTAGYGGANFIGQIVGIWISHSLLQNEVVICSFILSSICALGIVIISTIPVGMPIASLIALMGMFLLGLVGSVQQLVFSAIGATFSTNAMLEFFVGQSFAGLIPGPAILITRTVANWSNSELTPAIVGIWNTSFNAVFCLSMIPVYLIWVSKSAAKLREISRFSIDDENRSFWEVFRKYIFKESICIYLIALVTFAIYPRILLKWEPAPDSWFDETSSYQTFMIYLSTIFDIIGITIPLWHSVPSQFIAPLTGIRVFFIPLFWLAGQSNCMNDWYRIFLVAAISFSGAILFGSLLNSTPNLVPAPLQDIVGYISSLCFAFGITSGGLCGYVLDRWVET